MSVNKGLFTVKEVAEVLGVHPRTVRRYLQEGVLKGKKIGGQWRFTMEDIKVLQGQGFAEETENAESAGTHALQVRNAPAHVCSFVEYNIKDIGKIRNTAGVILDAIGGFAGNFGFKFEMVAKEGKARYTLWGEPSVIAEVLLKIE